MVESVGERPVGEYNYEAGVTPNGQVVRLSRKHPTLVELHPQTIDIPLTVLMISVAQVLAALAGVGVGVQVPGDIVPSGTRPGIVRG